MNKLVFLCLMFTGCGYSSMNNEITGQVKKVFNVTPLICFDRTDIDLSLGVMRNGVGSMSTQDMYATAYDPAVIATLKKASETGALVKVVHQEARIRFCASSEEITAAEILK